MVQNIGWQRCIECLKLQVSFRKRDNQYKALFEHLRETSDGLGIVLQCVAMCCSVSRCVAVCCDVLQCVAVSCSVCSALQCVATPTPHTCVRLVTGLVLMALMMSPQ